jgi:hypothetical protein
MLDKIRDTLEGFGKTYYGNADPKETDIWDYYVFRRATLKKAGSGTDFVRRYTVAIVKEDYIPEGHEFEIIKAIREATRMRLADVDISYNYTFKGATSLVVEVAMITFAESIKGCEI